MGVAECMLPAHCVWYSHRAGVQELTPRFMRPTGRTNISFMPRFAGTTEMVLKSNQLLDYIQEAIRLNAACQADWQKQLRREFRPAVAGTPVPHVIKLLGLLTELATLEGTGAEFVATAVELPDDAESDDEYFPAQSGLHKRATIRPQCHWKRETQN